MALFKGGLFKQGLFKQGLFGRIADVITNLVGGGQLRKKRRVVFSEDRVVDYAIYLRGIGNISSDEAVNSVSIVLQDVVVVRSREEREKELMMLISMKMS